MIALTDLQERFQRHLLRGHDPLPGIVVDQGKVSAAGRLDIYREAYKLRLIEALQADFRGLHHMLGDEQFGRVCRDYILERPSRHPSIRWFGKDFANFLATNERYRDEKLLGELAQLDWAISLSFDAIDVAVVALEDMGVVPPEAWPSLRIEPHPSVSRLDLLWNVGAMRRAADKDEAPQPPESGSWPIPWLVWRKDLNARYRSASVDEAWAWDRACQGDTFATLCEGLCEWVDPENVGPRAAELLKVWIVDEMVARIRWDDC